MAFLVLIKDGAALNQYRLEKEEFSIGRAPDNDIYVDNPEVSKKHAVIKKIDDRDSGVSTYYVQDLESKNGTFVNEHSVKYSKLEHNDILRVGWNHYKFVDETAADADETLKIHKSWIPGVYYTKKK